VPLLGKVFKYIVILERFNRFKIITKRCLKDQIYKVFISKKIGVRKRRKLKIFLKWISSSDIMANNST
jgi:hypothetical protein